LGNWDDLGIFDQAWAKKFKYRAEDEMKQHRIFPKAIRVLWLALAFAGLTYIWGTTLIFGLHLVPPFLALCAGGNSKDFTCVNYSVQTRMLMVSMVFAVWFITLYISTLIGDVIEKLLSSKEAKTTK
jgi:hypothetical protein